MMASRAIAVVCDEPKVRGLAGLRVVDAAAMPTVTSTNTHAPTIMLVEKSAALMKGAARQRLAAW
jgi:choline dehydrogenase